MTILLLLAKSLGVLWRKAKSFGAEAGKVLAFVFWQLVGKFPRCCK